MTDKPIYLNEEFIDACFRQSGREFYSLLKEGAIKIPVSLAFSDEIKQIAHDFHGKEHCFESLPRDGSTKKTLSVRINSYCYSINAIHWYAKVVIPCPRIAVDGDTNVSVNTKERLDCRLAPINIDIQRKMVKLERDLSGEPLGKVGDWTYRFNSKEGAYAAAIAFIKEGFSTDWLYETKYYE
jgi:hypothetical protein